MSHEPIQRLEVDGYGCIQHAVFDLSPLHALIGPNDSGKSTALRALRTLAQFAAADFGPDPNERPAPFDPMLDYERGRTNIAVQYADGLSYRIRSGGGIHESVWLNAQEVVKAAATRGWNVPGLLNDSARHESAEMAYIMALRARMTAATMVRFNADNLRAPGQLIPEAKGIAFMDERGSGLASVYDAIINRDSESFTQIQSDVRIVFPSVAKVGLINISSSHKEIAVTLTDGTRVGARAMSEGLLCYLGFVALKHLDGSRLFLVEEPENGLHPVRIVEVMRVFREMSKTSQIVIATHSPIVVNELDGREITVVTRDKERGTRAQLLKDTPNYDERAKIYMNGELWVAYGDGATEDAIVNGGPRP